MHSIHPAETKTSGRNKYTQSMAFILTNIGDKLLLYVLNLRPLQMVHLTRNLSTYPSIFPYTHTDFINRGNGNTNQLPKSHQQQRVLPVDVGRHESQGGVYFAVRTF